MSTELPSSKIPALVVPYEHALTAPRWEDTSGLDYAAETQCTEVHDESFNAIGIILCQRGGEVKFNSCSQQGGSSLNLSAEQLLNCCVGCWETYR